MTMNDNELIKALEKMSDEDPEGFSSDILGFINRKQAEIKALTIRTAKQEATIERLEDKKSALQSEVSDAQAEIERLQELLEGWKTEAYKVADEKDKLYCEAVEKVKTTKAEVAKELAKKIRQKIVVMVCSPDLLTLDDYDKCIDDVLKEMEDDSSE